MYTIEKYHLSANTKLYYQIHGDGKQTILLIHGWPFTSLEWQNLIPYLVNQHNQVMTIDLPGCGMSDVPEKALTKFEIAKVIDEILNAEKLNDVTVLGTDIGMMVAYSLAANFPEIISKVILGEGALPGFGLEELMDVAKGGSWHFGFQMQAKMAASVIAGNERKYYSNFYKIMSNSGSQDEFIDKHIAFYQTEKQSLDGFYHYQTLLEDAKFNQENPNQRLTMPVLILNGEQGIPQFVTENSVKQVADHYQNAIVSNCAHTLGEDYPEETAQHILNFIND